MGRPPLRAQDFMANNPEHLELLRRMGVSLIHLKDGRVQLVQHPSQVNKAYEMKRLNFVNSTRSRHFKPSPHPGSEHGGSRGRSTVHAGDDGALQPAAERAAPTQGHPDRLPSVLRQGCAHSWPGSIWHRSVQKFHRGQWVLLFNGLGGTNRY